MKTINELQKKTSSILKKYPVTYAGVFGSFARGEMKRGSDIDILIGYKKPFSLLDLIRLETELKEKLNEDVDVITDRAINKSIKPFIIRDLKYFYGKR